MNVSLHPFSNAQRIWKNSMPQRQHVREDGFSDEMLRGLSVFSKIHLKELQKHCVKTNFRIQLMRFTIEIEGGFTFTAKHFALR